VISLETSSEVVVGKSIFTEIDLALSNSTLNISHLYCRRRQQEQVGPSAKLKIKLTLEDIYNGRELPVTYYKMAICPHCRGSGADNPEDITVCNDCGG
jgi:DnaJ-class molecular chaperone